jgi:hypothetical protein
MHYYNSQVDPGKTKYGKLVARADSIRAECAEKIAMQGETVLGPVPAVKDQPQRLYDPYSLSNVVRNTSPPASSESPVNPLDGPFAGLVDRGDQSAELLPKVNLPLSVNIVSSEATKNMSNTSERPINWFQEMINHDEVFCPVVVERYRPSTEDWPYHCSMLPLTEPSGRPILEAEHMQEIHHSVATPKTEQQLLLSGSIVPGAMDLDPDEDANLGPKSDNLVIDWDSGKTTIDEDGFNSDLEKAEGNKSDFDYEIRPRQKRQIPQAHAQGKKKVKMSQVN